MECISEYKGARYALASRLDPATYANCQVLTRKSIQNSGKAERRQNQKKSNTVCHLSKTHNCGYIIAIIYHDSGTPAPTAMTLVRPLSFQVAPMKTLWFGLGVLPNCHHFACGEWLVKSDIEVKYPKKHLIRVCTGYKPGSNL